jgi:hypothetical protein
MERRAVRGLIVAATLCVAGAAQAFTMGETSAALGTQGTLNATGGTNAAAMRKSITDGIAKASASQAKPPGGKPPGAKPSSGGFGGGKCSKGSWVTAGGLGGKSTSKGSWVGPGGKSGGGAKSGWASASAKGSSSWSGAGDLGSKSGKH